MKCLLLFLFLFLLPSIMQADEESVTYNNWKWTLSNNTLLGLNLISGETAIYDGLKTYNNTSGELDAPLIVTSSNENKILYYNAQYDGLDNSISAPSDFYSSWKTAITIPPENDTVSQYHISQDHTVTIDFVASTNTATQAINVESTNYETI